MKYLNRQRLGIEAFLAARSGVFSRHNELTPDELINRLRVQPFSVRNQVVQDVRSAITELTSGKYDTGSLIPPHIEALCDDYCSPERVGKLRPFFAWLQSLWRDNDQARSEWISQLKTVARNLNTVSGDCLMAVSTGYNNQRALMERLEDGSIVMSLHERRWGRLSISFPHCENVDEQCLPVLGFMYIIEGEVLSDDRYRFEILFDTEFGIKNDAVRALRPNSWKQVSFTCAAPRVELEPIDYARAAEVRGASKLETVRYSSEVLCEKVSLAGEAMLSAAERRALPFARLISASKTLADKGKRGDMKSEDTLLELAENRYVFEQITELFEKEKAQPLCALMNKITECMDNEDEEKALNNLRKLSLLTDELCSRGGLMPLLEKLETMMIKAGKCEEAPNNREAVFRKATEAFSKVLEPKLNKLGFSGEYPNYRRIKRGKAEYISAIIDREPDALDGGNLSYGFVLCASQVKTKRAERKAGNLRGIAFENTCAADFFNERPEYSNSGIVDCMDEPGYIQVSVDILTGETLNIDEAAIDKMLKCIKRAFAGRNLKVKERRKRKERVNKYVRRKMVFSAYLSAFERFMPTSNIMCAVVAALYLWGRTQFDIIANIGVRTAVFPIALAGIVTALLRALFYCLRRKKKLWMY